jgi:Undecaprenyl-phosphate glucose phosphotransferase
MAVGPSSANHRSAARISVAFIGNLTALLDVLAISATGVLAYIGCLQPSWDKIDTRYLAAIVAGGVTASLIFRWLDVYSSEELYTLRQRLVVVVEGWIVTFAILLAMGFSLKISDSFARVWAFAWLSSATVILLLTRYALWRRIEVWSRDSRFAERAVIVGAGENGQRLARHFGQQQGATLQIVGFVDDRTTRIPTSVENYPILGNIDHLIQLIRDGLVDQVIIALPWSAEQRLQDLIYRLALTPAHIRLAPDFVGLVYSDRPFIHQGGVAMLRVLDRPISGWMYVAKRMEDILLAVAALLILSPLLLGIWIAVKLDSPGPAFFRQPRYGFNNVVIQVLKFRTMHAAMTDIGGERQTARNDERVTRIGRWLRKMSFDELPQLFNVLRGDMSIVGPRAHPIKMTIAGKLLEVVVRQYAARHRVKPGITGWAQVHGLRGELNSVEKLERRTEYDLYYINNWSVWLDLLIILKTIPMIIRDPNAY